MAAATSWHIIETRLSGEQRHRHSYSAAPRAARVLRDITAPYRSTHRIARLRRQRANRTLSHVRLTLVPRADGPEIELAAMMIREVRRAA